MEGQGVNQFLLSKSVYGPESLTINAKIRFFDYEAFADEAPNTANAGIVFGWEKQRYFHLLFDGTRLLLEEVGAQGGGHYHDFKHIHKGVEFQVKEGELYRVAMHVRALQLEVHVDNRFQFSARLPREAQGKVGLRPWRSRIECTFFEVSDE